MTDLAAALGATAPVPEAPKPKRPRKKAAKKRVAKKKAASKKVAKAAVAPVRRGRLDIQLDLESAMKLASGLHRTDMPVFTAIVNALSNQGAPSRKRLLAAIGNVFVGRK